MWLCVMVATVCSTAGTARNVCMSTAFACCSAYRSILAYSVAIVSSSVLGRPVSASTCPAFDGRLLWPASSSSPPWGAGVPALPEPVSPRRAMIPYLGAKMARAINTRRAATTARPVATPLPFPLCLVWGAALRAEPRLTFLTVIALLSLSACADS